MIKRIGKYLLLQRRGRGGMSEVHKAKNSSNDSIVALKILLPRDDLFVDLAGEERLREIFYDEARIMAAIRHECIAKIIESGEDDGFPYIALEYFPRSLGSVIGDSTRTDVTPVLGIEPAAAICDRPCAALKCCTVQASFTGTSNRTI